MLTPTDVQKLDDNKISMEELERMIDTSIKDFHGDYPWELAIIDGEYSDTIMKNICLKYKGVGWRHVYWSRSSETEDKPGLTQIKFSATEPIEDKYIQNMHAV